MNNNKKLGFSMIEILIALGIFAVISVVSLDLFISSVRATNKVRVINEVKQNGESMMSVLDVLIRNSGKIDSFSGGVCSIPPPADTNCTEIKFSNDLGIPWSVIWTKNAGLTQNGRIEIKDENNQIFVLSNTNPLSGIDVASTSCTDCGFTKLAKSNNNAPDIIKVKLVLQQGRMSPTRQDFQANIVFERTISLRATL
jgi:prepilin-type N-terminal cleavage/methylation domain-containing protein